VVYLTEQVSSERFDDFKSEMIRAICDLRGAIDTLSNKIDTYNNVSQAQSQDIAVLKVRTEKLEESKERLEDKVSSQEIEIARFKTESKIKQRNLAIYFTFASLIIGIVSVCIAIFK
jgi:chromosome segregation ATPase